MKIFSIINSLFQSSMVQNLGLLAVRLVASMMLIAGHGFGKFSNLLNGHFDFLDPLGIGSMASLIAASTAEFLCPWLIILGLFTRFTAIPIVFTMLIAGVVVHGGDPLYPEFLGNLSPKHPNLLTPFKEYALLYALLFSMFIFTGPGKISLDFFFGIEKKAKK